MTISVIQNAFNNSGLVGYWKLDEGTGTTTADLSGFNNNGTFANNISGGTLPSWSASGKYGNCIFISSEPNGGYVNLGNNSSLSSINATGTVSCWFNGTNTHSTYQTLVSCGKIEDDTNGFSLAVDPSGNAFIETCNATSATTLWGNTTGLLNGTWHHMAATWNGSAVSLYVDGNLVGVSGSQVTPFCNVWPFTIGAAAAHGSMSSDWGFNGYIDDVRIFNRALSNTEITSLYTGSGSGTTNNQVVLHSSVTANGGAGGTTTYIFLTNTTFTVPSDWNNANNLLAVIGAGGPGSNGADGGSGSGGGGGQYASVNNVTLTPGASVYVTVGLGSNSSSPGSLYGNSWINFQGNAPPTNVANGCLAVSGNSAQAYQGAPTTNQGGAGGTGGIGSVLFSGGKGGNNNGGFDDGGEGGGGAGGPNGSGANGQGTTSADSSAGKGWAGGAGGGGADGGGIGSAVETSYLAGNGGISFAGNPGGVGSHTTGVAGGAGANGSGGGGGWSDASTLSATATIGGTGGTEQLWSNGAVTVGPGGGAGGGGAGSPSANGGNGGLYGGGGGGGGGGGSAGTWGRGGFGANGVAVIQYTTVGGNITYTVTQNQIIFGRYTPPSTNVNVTQTGFVSNTSTSNSFTLAGAIGSGDGTRNLMFFIGAGQNIDTHFDITGVTVEGVTATQMFEQAFDQTTLGAYAVKASDLPNPAATSVNVAITVSTSINRGVCMFSCVTTDNVSFTPYGTASDYKTQDGVTTTLVDNVSINTPSGAAVIGWCLGYFDNLDASKSISWSGLTKQDEQQYGSPGRRASLATANSVAAQTPMSITASGSVATATDIGNFATAVVVLKSP
jgi:hypothetical protein